MNADATTAPNPATTVLVVDDQQVVREGLLMLLGLLDGVQVLGAAQDGDQAVELAQELDPDVVLMDLNMPGCGGVEATERLTALGSRAKVVVLTTYADDESVFSALQAGARGFLTKDASPQEIGVALRTVAAGEAQLDASVQRRLLEALTSGARYAIPQPPSLSGVSPVLAGGDELTPRELEVLAEVAAGRSNAEIASALFVSEATVKTHINHLLQKTGLRDRAQLVSYAFRSGIVTG